jgi:hypothetical protein
MSHQDKDCRTEIRYHYQALLSAVSWLCSGVDFDSLKLRRDCTWSARMLATAALLWAWSDKQTLGLRFTKSRQMACKMFGARKKPAGSYQAFLKLLVRWTPSLAELLTEAFRKRMKERFPKRLRIAGFWAFCVDGSRMALPRTKSNEAAYSAYRKRSGKKRRSRRKKPRDKAHTKKANSPQLWLTVLWHLGTQLPWSWRMGPSDSSERSHLLDMIADLPRRALLVADAGFTGYNLWRALLDAEHELLVRVGSSVKLLKNLGYVRPNNDLVICWPDRAAAKNQKPLVLRLVVLRDKGHPVYLVTSVLDKKRLSDQEVAMLYGRRWGIEVFYRHLKQTFERSKLRSRSNDHAAVEAEWSLLGLWAMTLHTQHYQQSQRLAPTRLSVARMLAAYRLVMCEYNHRPEPGEDLYSALSAAQIDNYQRTSSKTSRDYPRKKKEPPPKPPIIATASKAQIKKAANIKRMQQQGLTA